MRVPVHHYYDGEADGDFCSGDYHDEKDKQLPVYASIAACRVEGKRFGGVHFGKCNEQQVDRIEHELYAHENDDDIAAGQYADNAYAKQDKR